MGLQSPTTKMFKKKGPTIKTLSLLSSTNLILSTIDPPPKNNETLIPSTE